MSQVVDTDFDAKATIRRKLEDIRDRRLGRPVPREAFDRSSPTARRAFAETYVDTMLAAGYGPGTDREAWVVLVDEHLVPAPGDRLWLGRRRVRREPPTLCVEIEAAAAAGRRRAQASLMAWKRLRGLGLAGTGEAGDLVTEVLAQNLPDPDAGRS